MKDETIKLLDQETSLRILKRTPPCPIPGTDRERLMWCSGYLAGHQEALNKARVVIAKAVIMDEKL